MSNVTLRGKCHPKAVFPRVTLDFIIAAMVKLLALKCLTFRILGLVSPLTLLGARMLDLLPNIQGSIYYLTIHPPFILRKKYLKTAYI